MNIAYGITHIRESLVYLLSKCKFLDDETYTCIKYRLIFRKRINLQNPQTWNEKIQWLKLYDQRPEYVQLVDKFEVRKYIADNIGNEYLIPLLGVWNHPQDIDFDRLPNQFVLKCTHDSGSVVICKDKKTFDKEAAIKKLQKKAQRNLYWWSREWVYKDLKPRIIAEEYMEDQATGELRDYKFFCYNGICKGLFIASDRQNCEKPTTFDFFDRDFTHLDVRQGHPNAETIPDPPHNMSEMIFLAEKLSKDMPFVRIDFYEVNGKIYFGEITFFHNGGFVPFNPTEWDEKLGKLIELPCGK